MSSLARLPAAQVAALSASYRAQQAAKARSTAWGLLILLLLVLTAGYVAEVDLAKLWANLGHLTSYFYPESVTSIPASRHARPTAAPN